MKKTLKFLLLLLVTLGLTGCASVKGLKNFVDCSFDFNSVSNVRLASIDITNAKSIKSLKITDAPKILSAISNKSLGLSLNVNVDVKNPNNQAARLDGFDYILWIDDMEMLSGSMDKQLNVGANQKSTLAIPFTLNLSQILTPKKLGSTGSFAFGLATDNADNSRVKVSLKPYFTIGSKTIKFPSYITIGGDKIMPSKSK